MSTYPSNLAKGQNALQNISSDASNNIAFGNNAGSTIINGNNNTFIGANTNINSSSNNFSNSTAIGYGATIDSSNQIVLGRTSENVYIPSKLGISTHNNTNSTIALDVSGIVNIYGSIGSTNIINNYITATSNGSTLNYTTYNPLTQTSGDNGYIYFLFNNVNSGIDGTLTISYNIGVDVILANYVLIGAGGGGSNSFKASGSGGGASIPKTGTINLIRGNIYNIVTPAGASNTIDLNVDPPPYASPAYISLNNVILVNSPGGQSAYFPSASRASDNKPGGGYNSMYSGGTTTLFSSNNTVYGGGGAGGTSNGFRVSNTDQSAAGGSPSTITFNDGTNTSYISSYGGSGGNYASTASVTRPTVYGSGGNGGNGAGGTNKAGSYGADGVVLIYIEKSYITNLIITSNLLLQKGLDVSGVSYFNDDVNVTGNVGINTSVSQNSLDIVGNAKIDYLSSIITSNVNSQTYNPYTQTISDVSNGIAGFAYYFFTSGTNTFTYKGNIPLNMYYTVVGGGGGGCGSQSTESSSSYYFGSGGGGGNVIDISSAYLTLNTGDVLTINVGVEGRGVPGKYADENTVLYSGSPSSIYKNTSTLIAYASGGGNGGGFPDPTSQNNKSVGGTSGSGYVGGQGLQLQINSFTSGGGAGAGGAGGAGGNTDTAGTGGIGKKIVFADLSVFTFGVGGNGGKISSNVNVAPNNYTGNGGYGANIPSLGTFNNYSGTSGGSGAVLLYFKTNQFVALNIIGDTNIINGNANIYGNQNIYGSLLVDKFCYSPTYPGAYLVNGTTAGSQTVYPIFSSISDASVSYNSPTTGNYSVITGTSSAIALNTGIERIILNPGYAITYYTGTSTTSTITGQAYNLSSFPITITPTNTTSAFFRCYLYYYDSYTTSWVGIPNPNYSVVPPF